MPKSVLDHALIVVLAMRLPDFLAAQQAPQQRDRSVADERRKNQCGKPDRPDAVAPAPIAESAPQKAERNRPGVAEEDFRGVEVKEQKTRGGACHGGRSQAELW